MDRCWLLEVAGHCFGGLADSEAFCWSGPGLAAKLAGLGLRRPGRERRCDLPTTQMAITKPIITVAARSVPGSEWRAEVPMQLRLFLALCSIWVVDMTSTVAGLMRKTAGFCSADGRPRRRPPLPDGLH